MSARGAPNLTLTSVTMEVRGYVTTRPTPTWRGVLLVQDVMAVWPVLPHGVCAPGPGELSPSSSLKSSIQRSNDYDLKIML